MRSSPIKDSCFLSRKCYPHYLVLLVPGTDLSLIYIRTFVLSPNGTKIGYYKLNVSVLTKSDIKNSSHLLKYSVKLCLNDIYNENTVPMNSSNNYLTISGSPRFDS